MAQLELLIVAPRSHICWDPAPAACLASLSWNSSSPPPRSSLSPYLCSSSCHQQCSCGRWILDKPDTQTWVSPTVWSVMGFAVTQLRGQPLRSWRMEPIWYLYNSVQKLHCRWFSSIVKKMLYGMLRLKNTLACVDTPSSMPVRAYSICMPKLVHLLPYYNTSSTPKWRLQFLICIRCTRSRLVFFWAFPMSWATRRSLCWLSFYMLRCSTRPCSFCLFTEIRFPALLTHRC